MLTDKIKSLHARGLSAAEQNKKSTSDLIEIFQGMDETKGYLYFGANSLFAYGVGVLNLCEGVVSNLITVARKARLVPELKEAIKLSEITLSKARKISSVITPSNQEDWLGFAKLSTSRAIEKEVARMNPKDVIREQIKYKTNERLEIRFGISEEADKDFRRVKDLIAQKTAHAPSSEEAFMTLIAEYLKNHDPLLKAERAQMKALKKEKHAESKSTSSDLKQKPLVMASETSVSARTNSMPMSQTHTAEKCISAHKLNKHFASNQQFPGRVIDTAASKPKPINAHSSKSFPKDTHASNQSRKKLPAHLEQAIHLRDKGQCTHEDQGKRCTQTRWLDTHHIIPKAYGGEDKLENLTTLCSSHHRFVHRDQRHSR